MRFTRITINHNQMGGVPCIKCLRIPVAMIVSLVADGMTMKEILQHYPDLEIEDIKEALHFASVAVKEREIHRKSDRKILILYIQIMQVIYMG